MVIILLGSSKAFWAKNDSDEGAIETASVSPSLELNRMLRYLGVAAAADQEFANAHTVEMSLWMIIKYFVHGTEVTCGDGA